MSDPQVEQLQTPPPTLPALLMSRPEILFKPGRQPSSRAIWANAAREYLSAFAAFVGLAPEEVNWDEQRDKIGRIERVTFVHPQFWIELRVWPKGTPVSIAYGRGKGRPLNEGVDRYFGVFANATKPGSVLTLVHRCRWLAGIEKLPFAVGDPEPLARTLSADVLGPEFRQMSMEEWLPLPVNEKVRRGVALLRERYLLAHSCEPSSDLMYRWKCWISSGVNHYRPALKESSTP